MSSKLIVDVGHGPELTVVELVDTVTLAKIHGDPQMQIGTLFALARGTGSTRVEIDATGIGFPFLELMRRVVHQEQIPLEVERVRR